MVFTEPLPPPHPSLAGRTCGVDDTYFRSCLLGQLRPVTVRTELPSHNKPCLTAPRSINLGGVIPRCRWVVGVLLSVVLGSCATSGAGCTGVEVRDPGAATTALVGPVARAVRSGSLEIQGHVVRISRSQVYGSCALPGAPCMARLFLRRGDQTVAADVFYWSATTSRAPVFEVKTIEYRFHGSAAVVLRDGMRWPLATRFSGCIRNSQLPQQAQLGTTFRVNAATGTVLSDACSGCE
jgi:hypothetical protein